MAVYSPQPKLGWDVVGPLQDYLTETFRSDGATETLIFDAGLDGVWEWANARDAAGKRWGDIIRWAREDDERIVALAEKALERYDNAQLRALVTSIRAGTQEGPSGPVVGAVIELPRPRILSQPERPLVDRADALAVLQRHIESAASGQSGGALLLLGESGIGKSRLAERAMRLADSSGLVILEAQCVGTTAEALLPIRDALSTYRGDRSVQELLAEGGAQLEPYVPFMQSFLGLQAGGQPARPIGGSRPLGVYEGLSQILVRLAARSGLCLVVEDLTDADRDTLAFLEYLHLKSESGRIVTITTVKRDLAGDRLLARLREWLLDDSDRYEVPPLGPDDAAQLVRDLPDGSALAPDQVERVLDLAGGNPYFLEQLVRYAVERPEADGAAELPADLGTVLSRRLALLDKPTRRFVEAASVALENTQRLDLVMELAGVKARKALRLLANAVDRQCLREDPDGGVWFVQELLRRAVYAQLGANARLTFHGLAASRLEGDGLLATAAHHYQRAGRTEEAVRTGLEGAAQAEYRGAYPTAVELYRLVMTPGDAEIGLRLARASIVLADREGASAALESLDQEAPDVRFLRAQLAFLDGRHQRAAEETERILALLPTGRLDARVWLAGIYLYLGRMGVAREHAEAALADAGGDVTLEARCHGIIGASWFYSGDLDAAEHWFHVAASALSAVPTDRRDRFVYTTILGNLGGVREALGDWTGARQFHDEALASRRAISDARGSLHSLHGVLNTEIGRGDVDAARSLLAQARELATRLGDKLELAKLDHSEALLALGTGDSRAAIELATAALDQFRELGTVYDVTHARFTLAAANRAAGRMQQANDEDRTARAEARNLGFGLLERLYPEAPAGADG
jgi:tetratricopeptide (TPR) repeat protein